MGKQPRRSFSAAGLRAKMMKTKVFAVLRRRDDLPEMTLPLAMLFLLGTAVFAVAGAALATPADPAHVFAVENWVGVAACLPFLPLAGCLYALLLLLWRRAASLLATPLMFAGMLLFGVDVFTAAAIAVSLFFLSYVYAVSLISHDSRFRRLASLAAGIGLCLGLVLLSWMGLHFDSPDACMEACMENIPPLLGQIFFGGAGAMGVMVPPQLLRNLTRELLLLLPGILGFLAVLLAWFMDFLAAAACRLLSCEGYFMQQKKTVLPYSYAVVYVIVLVCTLGTPPAVFPLVGSVLRSALLVLLLPCAAAGLTASVQFMEEKFYYLTQEKWLAALVLLLAFLLLGLPACVLVLSVVGTVHVIRQHFRQKKTDKNE